jgi:hypothetical protein
MKSLSDKALAVIAAMPKKERLHCLNPAEASRLRR